MAIDKDKALKVLEALEVGIHEIAPKDQLLKKLEKGIPLRIKLGADPTAPDLHLGHAVVLSKLKQFQDLGHKIIFLIGDFTARIGDPTGKSKTRIPLSAEEIVSNSKTYFKQVGKILDLDKVEIVYNSQWLSKLSSEDFLKLASQITVARLIEREDFANRIKSGQAVGFHELLYPLLQGYDSVVLNSDIEIGGTDQTFNLLVGRHLQEQNNQEPQVIMTTPLLPGLEGGAKMSKSLGNAIGLTEEPEQAYGKLMSISDELMFTYLKLLLNYDVNTINEFKEKIKENKIHPIDLKKRMAYEIVSKFWNQEQANIAQEQFENLFQKKDYSSAKLLNVNNLVNKQMTLLNLIKSLDIIKSSSEIKRLILSNAISINNEKIANKDQIITIKSGDILKVGKRKIYQIA